jgi:hypothetical protein
MRSEWDFRNKKRSANTAPRPKYIKKGHKKRQGKRFKYRSYSLCRLEDLPKDHQKVADLLEIGQFFDIKCRNLNQKNAVYKRIERTF